MSHGSIFTTNYITIESLPTEHRVVMLIFLPLYFVETYKVELGVESMLIEAFAK